MPQLLGCAPIIPALHPYLCHPPSWNLTDVLCPFCIPWPCPTVLLPSLAWYPQAVGRLLSALYLKLCQLFDAPQPAHSALHMALALHPWFCSSFVYLPLTMLPLAPLPHILDQSIPVILEKRLQKSRDGKNEMVTWKSLVALKVWLGLWY